MAGFVISSFKDTDLIDASVNTMVSLRYNIKTASFNCSNENGAVLESLVTTICPTHIVCKFVISVNAIKSIKINITDSVQSQEIATIIFAEKDLIMRIIATSGKTKKLA